MSIAGRTDRLVRARLALVAAQETVERLQEDDREGSLPAALRTLRDAETEVASAERALEHAHGVVRALRIEGGGQSDA